MQFDDADILDLPRPFLVRDVGPDDLDVLTGLVRFTFQKFPGLFVNLTVTLGKTVNQFLGHTGNLEIAARIVFNAVAKSLERPDHFVIIDIPDELLRRDHFTGFQCLPAAFNGIARGIEQDAMGVQVRIQCSGGIVPEHRPHHIARHPMCILILFANPCGSVGLQFTHGHRHRLIMRLDDPLVIANQCCNGNRFRR